MRDIFHDDLDDIGKSVIEMGETTKIFSNPVESATEDYISGRFG